VLLLCATPAGAQTVRDEPDVADLAARAEAAAQQDRWTDALDLYRLAREQTADANTRRDLQLNIGVCLMGIGHHVEAIDAFDAFVAEGGDASAVDRLLAQATAQVGTLELRVTPANATARIDGVVREGVGGVHEVHLDPGPHRIEVEAEGYVSQALTLSAHAGTRDPVEISLSAAPVVDARVVADIAPPQPTPAPSAPPAQSSRSVTDEWWFWLATVGGGAVLVGLAIGLGVALSPAPDAPYRTGNIGGVVFTLVGP
jgi:hypothetical protein